MRNKQIMKIIIQSLCFFILLFNNIIIAQNFDDVTIKTTQVSEHVYMLVGAGGNIGVSVGDDGVFMIDSQFAPLSSKIIAEIQKISNQPIRFLVNTHHHGDHIGGNVKMHKSGTTIIAHDNVRKNLDGKPIEILPIITFNDKLNLYLNGEQILFFHIANAHTNGDALLYFNQSNVLHTGDTYFNGRYPYIDLNNGGSVDGYIAAAKNTLILIDDNTKIIPGHGELSNKTEYETFLKMLETVKANVVIEINNGKTEDEVAANTTLTETYDSLGYGDGFINSEKMRRTFYLSLKN
jgi:glyoxylase-like metal-dependent hydrolase (beta-lactamase superfamily II)